MTADRGNKERKQYLERRRLINCGRCKPNQRENAKRKPKPDIGKNHRRD